MPNRFEYASNGHIKQDTELLLQKLDKLLELFKDLTGFKEEAIELQPNDVDSE